MLGATDLVDSSPRQAKGKGADQPTAQAPENNGQRYRVLGAASVVLLHGAADHGANENAEPDPLPRAAVSIIVDSCRRGTRTGQRDVARHRWSKDNYSIRWRNGSHRRIQGH